MLPPVLALQALAEHPAAVLADVRWYPDGRSVAAEYASGHLPGAVLVDLESVLCGPPSAAAGRHPLPTPEAFAAGLSSLGIGDQDTVLAYDDAGGVLAARLVWMLRALGQEAALLDGGLQAWTGPLQRAAPPRQPASCRARPWPAGRLATIEEVAAGTELLLDARPPERYAGAPDELDPRAGHIPGARSLSCREHLGEGGTLLPDGALRARFAAVGVAPGVPFISSCGSGVTACHNLLVAERLGLGPGRLFVGSWSQWSRDPARRLVTGPAPG